MLRLLEDKQARVNTAALRLAAQIIAWPDWIETSLE